MSDYELLKSIFENAHKGIYEIPELPEGISREVVENNVLYIEMCNLKKSNSDSDRIAEIESILYPPQEDEEE